MRVLDILASADPATGGPLEGVFRRSEIWQAAGHTCELATLDPPGTPYLAGAPLLIHALGRPRPAGWYRYLP